MRSKLSRWAGAVAAALVSLAIPAGSAAAGDYVVQIGAFRFPSAGYGAAAVPIGEVTTREVPSGLTLFEVGRFETLEDARRARAALRAAGYADAFVRRVGPVAAAAPAPAPAGEVAPPEVSAVPPPAPTSPSRERFERLPPEVRVRTVYVDGRLHVKEGDRFIPLEDYEGGRYR